MQDGCLCEEMQAAKGCVSELDSVELGGRVC